ACLVLDRPGDGHVAPAGRTVERSTHPPPPCLARDVGADLPVRTDTDAPGRRGPHRHRHPRGPRVRRGGGAPREPTARPRPAAAGPRGRGDLRAVLAGLRLAVPSRAAARIVPAPARHLTRRPSPRAPPRLPRPRARAADQPARTARADSSRGRCETG